MGWDPLRDLLTTQEHLQNLFGRNAGWMPTADLYETADRFVLTVELPGLTRADVQLEFHGDTLLVRGERTGVECTEKFHQIERGHGPFARSFRFGQPVQDQAITAELADGVLTIQIPKARGPEAVRVDVR